MCGCWVYRLDGRAALTFEGCITVRKHSTMENDEANLVCWLLIGRVERATNLFHNLIFSEFYLASQKRSTVTSLLWRELDVENTDGTLLEQMLEWSDAWTMSDVTNDSVNVNKDKLWNVTAELCKWELIHWQTVLRGNEKCGYLCEIAIVVSDLALNLQKIGNLL